MLFSSIASVLGVAGRMIGDYAYANAFLDHFAEWRERQRGLGTRFGRTLSLNWPLWQGGGMDVTDSAKNWFRQVLGMSPLDALPGLAAFETALASGSARVTVIAGDANRIRKTVSSENSPAPVLPEKPSEGGEYSRLKTALEKHLRGLLAKEAKLDPGDVRSNEPLERYGIDSVMVVNLTAAMEKDFGELSKTLAGGHQPGLLVEKLSKSRDNRPPKVRTRMQRHASKPPPAFFRCKIAPNRNRRRISP